MTISFKQYFLKNGGSEDMAVDGSVTPVVFDLSAETFTTMDITSISCYIEAGGNQNSYTDFMTEPTLTNGVLLEKDTIGNIYSFVTIQSNRDLLRVFGPESRFLISELGNNNSFKGNVMMPTRGALIDSSGYVQVTIRDDLSTLDYMAFSVQGIVNP